MVQLESQSNNFDAQPKGTEVDNEDEDFEKKIEDLEGELEALEQKFLRSDEKIRAKTLLRMQKRTQDFLIWLARRDLEKSKERTPKEQGQ